MFLINRNISSKIKRSKVTDYAALTSEKLAIYLANQSWLSKLYFKLWAKEKCSKKKKTTVVVIYEVMHAEH